MALTLRSTIFPPLSSFLQEKKGQRPQIIEAIDSQRDGQYVLLQAEHHPLSQSVVTKQIIVVKRIG
jgi:hypothetical protein